MRAEIGVVLLTAFLVGVGLAPPASAVDNDDFSNAFAFSQIPFRHAGSTVGTTVEEGEPFLCGGGSGGSVWYRFTPAQAAHVKIDTAGSALDFDAVLDLYTGSRIGALRRVGCDTGTVYRDARIIFDTQPGVTYSIRVAGRYWDEGMYSLVVEPTVLPCVDTMIGTDLCYLSPAAPSDPIKAAASSVAPPS
jgi:hypothetical protein